MKNIAIMALSCIFSTATVARPFVDVTRAILSIVPATEQELRANLEILIVVHKTISGIPVTLLDNYKEPQLVNHLKRIMMQAPEKRELELWQDLASHLEKYSSEQNIINAWNLLAVEIYLDIEDYKQYLKNNQES